MEKKRKKPIYEETPYPSVEQAFDELSQEAFAVWIRLHVATEDQLCEGKRALGWMCNYSTGRFYKIMKELYCKDYVRYIKPDALGQPHTVVLHKRAMIGGKNHFVRLRRSRTASGIHSMLIEGIDSNDHEDAVTDEAFQAKTSNTSKRGVKKRKRSSSKAKSKSSERGAVEDGGPSRKELLAKGRRKYVERDNEELPLDEIEHPSSLPLPGPSPNPTPCKKKPNNKAKRKSSFASQTEDSLTTSSSTNAGGERKKIKSGKKNKKKETSLSKKMAEKRQEIKDKRSNKHKEKKVVKTWNIDYSKLDSKGDPSISFDPKYTRRDELIGILEAPTKGTGIKRAFVSKNKETKERTEAKLGHEFARIYKRYRNLIQDARKRDSRFVMPPSSEKYCGRIAIQCIYHEITPRQLLEYWDENIKHFAQGTFKHPYPTLSFLSGSYAAEQVAAALFEHTEGGNKKWKSGDFKRHRKSVPAGAHSFFDTEELDTELKQGLLDAGFEIGQHTKYDDRYLLTIQKTAQAIAKGKNIFIAGTMKTMVLWAVENLYCEDDE